MCRLRYSKSRLYGYPKLNDQDGRLDGLEIAIRGCNLTSPSRGGLSRRASAVSMQSVKKLWLLLDRRQRRNSLLLLALMVSGALLEVIGVGAIPAFVALLSSPERVLRYPAVARVFATLGADRPDARILWAAGAVAAFFVLKNGYLSAFTYLQSRFIYNRQIDLAKRLHAAYMNSPYTFHLQRNTADLVHNINVEVMRIISDILIPGLRIAMETLVLLAVFSLLLAVEPGITLLMLIVLGVTSGTFLKSVRKQVGKYGMDEHNCRMRMIQTANEGFGGLKDLKVLGRIGYSLAEFSGFASGYSRSGVYKNTIGELPRLFLETIAVLALLGAAALLVMQHRPMQEIVPTLTLLALASVRMMPSANRIVNAAVSVKWGVPALDAVYNDLSELERRAAQERRHETVPARPFREAIEFEGITYRYPGAASDALRDMSFRIPKGTAVAFVGASGAGKTTAADVLLGLLEPASGRVLVDGEDIRGDVSGWQKQIGYIPQHIFLTDDSIRRNIAFGIPDAEIDDQRVRAALDSAQLLQFVDALPHGLDTSVGERGVRLSGGQRQRIGIARALYHDPEVLVMDEATSALDYKTESLIIEMIERLRDTRTIVVIAHRHSTIQYFDRVVKLQDGRVVAQGSYSDIVETSAAS